MKGQGIDVKILLTGAQGFLGLRIAQAMPVIAAPSLRDASQDDVKRLMDEVQPEVVMHTAAISDIGECERDPDASRRANVLLPEAIARAAGGAKLLMLSTDQVYSGCADEGPYREDDVCPANLYARHKLEMEQRVLDVNPDAVLLRATWMYDMPICGAKNRGNFLMNVMQAAMTGQPVAFPKEQYRGITWAREVAERMKDAIALPGGVYNFGSGNDMSMYDTAAFLAQRMGLNLSLTEAPARRHLWMDGSKLGAQGISFRSTAQGLQDCLQAYGLAR